MEPARDGCSAGLVLSWRHGRARQGIGDEIRLRADAGAPREPGYRAAAPGELERGDAAAAERRQAAGRGQARRARDPAPESPEDPPRSRQAPRGGRRIRPRAAPHRERPGQEGREAARASGESPSDRAAVGGTLPLASLWGGGACERGGGGPGGPPPKPRQREGPPFPGPPPPPPGQPISSATDI